MIGVVYTTCAISTPTAANRVSRQYLRLSTELHWSGAFACLAVVAAALTLSTDLPIGQAAFACLRVVMGRLWASLAAFSLFSQALSPRKFARAGEAG